METDPGALHATLPANSRVGGRRRTLTMALAVATAIAGGTVGTALFSEDHGRRADSLGGSGAIAGTFDHEHTAWTSILSRFVRDGQVDYAGLKAGAQAELSRYLSSLGSVHRAHYERWTREQKLAFWIDAYNASTVKLIVDNHPITSIRRIGLLPGAAFRLPLLTVPAVSDSALSLNDIEHGILRVQFHEPRIHFAIVCASRSCPGLRSEAYRARDLDVQLEEAARGFLRDSTKNRYDAAAHALHLSPIFNWFRSDFEAASGSLPAFFARFADQATRQALEDGEVSVDFLDYDWTLNGRTP